MFRFIYNVLAFVRTLYIYPNLCQNIYLLKIWQNVTWELWRRNNYWQRFLLFPLRKNRCHRLAGIIQVTEAIQVAEEVPEAGTTQRQVVEAVETVSISRRLMNGQRAPDSHPITGLIPNWKKPETSGIPGQREWKRPSSTSVQQQSGLRKMRLGLSRLLILRSG